MRVRNTAQSSITLCQSLLRRDRRDTSVTSTIPTSPNPDRRNQSLKARALIAARARHPQIIINDLHLRRHPPHVSRPLGQLILPPRALLVLDELALRRLPHIDHGLQTQVTRFQLRAGQHRDVHGTVPLVRRGRPDADGAVAAPSRPSRLAGTCRAEVMSTLGGWSGCANASPLSGSAPRRQSSIMSTSAHPPPETRQRSCVPSLLSWILLSSRMGQATTRSAMVRA